MSLRPTPKVTIILPTYNEVRHGWLERITMNLKAIPTAEVLIVDSGSDDGTPEFFEEHGFTVERIPETHRAGRLDHGLKKARGEVLFLHHPRSAPDPNAILWLEQNAVQVTWGALTHRFDQSHPLLKFTSWYSNHIRGDLKQIYYLDHCLFVHRRLWTSDDSFPALSIFEDTRFCQILKERARSQRLPWISVTSATRFQKNGIFRQAVLNQVAKLFFWLNVPEAKINSLYERKLDFNQRRR